MRRLLAVAGALGMVALALVLRGVVGGDDADDTGGGDGPGRGGTVVCPPDLAAACEALDGVTVRVEAAGATADALRNGTLDGHVDAWLVPSVWVDVVASAEPGALDGRGTLVAASPVVVAVDPARVDAVADLCGADPVWRCLGDHAGQEWGALGGEPRWGRLRVGLPDVDPGPGLAVLASVATAYFGGTDFAAQDFDAPGADGTAFRRWLAGTGQRRDRDPLTTLVTTRGAYTAAGTPAAEAAGRRVEVLDAEPVVATELTLVAVAGRGGAPDPGPARAVLVDLGWEPAEGATPASPYPTPGVLAALRTLWAEVAR